jgi:putative PIN family toxin of toxin-antitoxin system
MDEYKKVLVRPKLKLSDTVLQQWFSIFEKHITVVNVQLPIDFPRDPKDAKFLACAIITQADIFISGDKDFSEAQKLLADTQILSVREFFNRFVAVLNPDLH